MGEHLIDPQKLARPPRMASHPTGEAGAPDLPNPIPPARTGFFWPKGAR